MRATRQLGGLALLLTAALSPARATAASPEGGASAPTTATTATATTATTTSPAATSVAPPPAPVVHPAAPAAPRAAPPRSATTSKGKSNAPKGPQRATRNVDPGARRLVAGGPTTDDVAFGAESPELRALRDAEHELFPAASPPWGAAWPQDLPSPLSTPESVPAVHASGLPPTPVPSSPPAAEGGRDLSWMASLALPELPVRWDPRVVRYLEFFKDDPRGRALLGVWLRRSGRYRELVKKTLRKKALPEDLFWLAMVESGFDPAARSPAGALGLWQFMGDTGRQYGLGQDRWVDYRLDVQAATEGAADFLSDLHRRFGSWELAMAAYNMGYTGVVATVKRYNTNDFWALSRMEGAIPWETTLYVPKIIAAAIVGRNLAAFGFADLATENPVEYEEVVVPPGTALSSVAAAAGCSTKELEGMNLALRASRTPPADPAIPETANGFPVHVPLGKAAELTKNLPRLKQAPLERYVVRFGETLEQIASSHGVPASRLVDINGMTPGEVLHGGTVLLLPRGNGSSAASSPSATPVVIVPADVFVYPDRKRVFYKVVTGDTLPEIASAFKVSVDEIRRWNEIDPVGRLQDGMTLQLFVPEGADLSRVAVLRDNDVRAVAVGSDDFFEYWEGQKNRRRISVTAKAGDTLESIGKRYGVTPGTMERINRRGRREKLDGGESIVLYLPQNSSSAGSATGSAAMADNGASPAGTNVVPEAEPNAPVPPAPAPDLLPPLR